MGKKGGPKLIRRRVPRNSKTKQRATELKPEWFPVYDDILAGGKPKDVAAKHGVSEKTVYNIVHATDKRLAIEFVDNVREMKARHTAQLEHVRREAMAAWERSKLDAESETVTTGGENGGSTSTTRKGQVGNPAYLETAMAAMDRQRKIWGADAPPKIEAELLLRVAGRPVEEANRELLEQIEIAKARLITSAPADDRSQSESEG